MKKLLTTLLFLVSIAYAQNISITKVDIDRAFGLPQGSKLYAIVFSTAISESILVASSFLKL